MESTANSDDENLERPTYIPIMDRLFLLPSINVPSSERNTHFSYFSLLNELKYVSYCDDFGPMNLAAVYRFCYNLQNVMENLEGDFAVVTSPPDPVSMTNVVFLLGAYMIMQLNIRPQEVHRQLEHTLSRTRSYRDVSPGEQNFHLHLIDCWKGLWRAKWKLGVNFETGTFDLSDYEHLDSPCNADLHEIVPGKFIAMKGPVSLPDGYSFHDTENGGRDFSPDYYAGILQQYDVRTVVRLNETRYDADEFLRHNIALADLPFEDCSIPPPDVVSKFLAIAEGIPGALAVHCKAGLGRTGTLIAIYLMKHHGFCARAAMGWLRIVRPGSIIARQQHFLCAIEPEIRCAGLAFGRMHGQPAALAADATVAEITSFISDTLTLDSDSGYTYAVDSDFHVRWLGTSRDLDIPWGFYGWSSLDLSSSEAGDAGEQEQAVSQARVDLAQHVEAAAERRSMLRAKPALSPSPRHRP